MLVLETGAREFEAGTLTLEAEGEIGAEKGGTTPVGGEEEVVQGVVGVSTTVVVTSYGQLVTVGWQERIVIVVVVL